MTIATMGDLLDRSAAYELALEAYYADLRDGCTDNGVRLLTYYLHRRHQHRALAQLGPGQLDCIRAIELEPVAEFEAPWMATVPVMGQSEAAGDDVLCDAISYVTHLAEYYRAIYRQVQSDEVARLLLGALIQLQERDIVMLNKMRDMKYL